MLDKRFVCALFLAVFVSAGIATAANDSTLIVIPSRYTMIQFAYDISRLRNSTIIAYETAKDSSVSDMHVWDSMANDWIKMTEEEFAAGDFPGADSKRMIVMGVEGGVPSVLTSSASWCSDIVEVPKISIVDMVNTLNKSMKFTASEWKWIARKHRLKIKDVNEKRRRYGKYGPPEGEDDPDSESAADPENVMRIPVPDLVPEPVEEPVETIKPEVEKINNEPVEVEAPLPVVTKPAPEPPVVTKPAPELPESKELMELEVLKDVAPEDK